MGKGRKGGRGLHLSELEGGQFLQSSLAAGGEFKSQFPFEKTLLKLTEEIRLQFLVCLDIAHEMLLIVALLIK